MKYLASILDEYSRSWRKYHNLHHIADCIDRLNEVRKEVNNYDNLMLAIMFHDLIYIPNSNSNELQSVIQAEYILSKSNIDKETIANIRNLIMVTTHERDCPWPDQDHNYMADIDLASLGYDWETFLKNTQNIRQEYPHVPYGEFCLARISVLRTLYARDSIYFTEYFRNKYEAQARRNINQSVELLRQHII